MQTDKKNIMSQIDVYIDMVIIAVSVYMAFFFTCLIDTNPPVFPTTPVMVIGILITSIIHSFLQQSFGAYQPYTPQKSKQAYFGIIKGNVLMFIVMMIAVLLFAERSELTFYAFWDLITYVLCSIFLISKRRFTLSVLSLLRRNQMMLKRTIIVGDNTASAKEYINEIAENPNAGVMILGYVGDKIEPDVGCDNLGSFKDLEKILDRYRPTDVVFAIDSYNKRYLIKLVNMCDDRCIRVSFLPVIFGFFKNTKQIEQIGDIPLINVHLNPLSSKMNAFVKRAVDIIGSIALIIATSPLMLVAIIGIKLTSDGPILFKQKRIGKLGKPFMMLKFRSMPVNRDTENNWSAPGDARPTKFGSFIRRTAIDELPQFFNVLMGTMSLVGPRPEIPKYVNKFREEIPLYMVKHYVKPGITGLAQIKGLRGDTSLEERIQADIAYIENWSLWLDISILIKTPFKAFNKYEKYVNRPKKERAGIIGAISAKIITDDEPIPQQNQRKHNQKILYAASTFSHIKNFHKKYIEALREDGHEVFVMASGKGADFNIPFEKKMFSKKNKECRKMISEIISKEKFDLIIMNTSLAAFHIRLALPKKGRPRTVNIVHGYLFGEDKHSIKDYIKFPMLSFAERFLRNKTDAILTMNDEDLRIATKKNLARGAIIPTFGMGVPMPVYNFPEGEMRKRHAESDDYIMLFVGELSRRKNQEFLIRSIPEIRKTIPKIRLWLIGEGDTEKELKLLAEKLGVKDRINFLGRKKNPADYIRDCDVYVSAAASEGLPFNIVEALGSGKSVLATRIKGHRDILDGGVGVMFTYGKLAEFARKIGEIKDGTIKISEKKISEAYYNFSEFSVFFDTYEKLKEASWL